MYVSIKSIFSICYVLKFPKQKEKYKEIKQPEIKFLNLNYYVFH